MKYTTFLALALAAAAANPFPAFAGSSKLAPDIARALEAGPRSVRIIVRARARALSPATVQEFRDDPSSFRLSPDALVALRRRQASENRRELDAFLRGLLRARPDAQSAGGFPVLKDLWFVNAYAVETTPEGVRQIQQRPDVEAIYLDRRVRWIGTVRRSGPEPARPPSGGNSAWGVTKIKAPAVWKRYKVRGQGVVIGHIDTGVDARHPAFDGRVLHFKDFTKAARTEPYDDEGHGTHTAGTIVGRTSNIGVAPEARLIVAKALDAQGSGELSGLLAAMQWMLDPDGKGRPAAVSNSWGADRESLGDEAGVFRDAVKAWGDAGIVPLFSSGNSGPDSQGVPAAYPESFAVGATTRADKDAGFSSGSNSEWDGQTYVRPDVAAPGEDVYSAAPGAKYATMSGTSMACPHVAGVVALVKSARPSLTVAEIEKILADTSKDLGSPGKDTRFGAGRLDALKAVKAARGGRDDVS